MIEPMHVFLFRMCFFLFSALIAASLILFSFSLASSNTAAFTLSDNASGDPYSVTHHMAVTVNDIRTWTGPARVVRDVGNGFYAVGRVPGRIVNSVASATDVLAFIKPADKAHAPVIKPLYAAPAAHVASQTAVAANTNVQSVNNVQVAAATPLPQAQTANSYARGNCTWWAANRRSQVNDPIPNSWGNAATWATRAARDGYLVDHHPSSGAIMQTPNSAGGLGHVAFVESVAPDGTWNISEMNVLGFNIVDRKAEPLSTAADYNFIHDKL